MKKTIIPQTFSTLFTSLKTVEREYSIIKNAEEILYTALHDFYSPNLDKLGVSDDEQEILEQAHQILYKISTRLHDKGGIIGKSLLKIA